MIVDSPECPYCGEEETPEHVFWICFKYGEQHAFMYNKLCKVHGLGPHPVEFLLANLDKDTIFILEKFLCSIPTFI